MISKELQSTVKVLSWKDVLYSHHVIGQFSMTDVVSMADKLGYKMLTWNDCVYKKVDGVWMRTVWTVVNIH